MTQSASLLPLDVATLDGTKALELEIPAKNRARAVDFIIVVIMWLDKSKQATVLGCTAKLWIRIYAEKNNVRPPANVSSHTTSKLSPHC